MEYWVLRDKTTNKYCYLNTGTTSSNFKFIKECLDEHEAIVLCNKLNKQSKSSADDVATLQDFYKISEVDWRDEFEEWLKDVLKPDEQLLPFYTWYNFYTDFAKQCPKVLWIPFGNKLSLISFNFIVCESTQDGFYNYFEFGQQFDEKDWNFVRLYRNRQDVSDFVGEYNKRKGELVKTLDWKEAMKALIDDKRVEARVCIPGLPESENKWFEVKFGESIEFGKDWEYRIKDDSKEREKLFEECEKLGIIDVNRVSKLSTPLLHNIVDAIKSIKLDWEEITSQVLY